MQLSRRTISNVCIVASFIATAGEQSTAGADNQPAPVELQLLQGTWEGVMVGDPPQKRVTITVTGNSLHFHRDTNFWFETTITLPAGKDPKQLHATIKGCPPSQADSVGQVVRAFFKIEDGTLTLATIGDDAEETPKGFEAAGTRYELRKVQSPKKDPQPHKPDEIGNAYESAPATLAASRNGDRHIADGRSACEDLLTRLSVQIWGPIENPV